MHNNLKGKLSAFALAMAVIAVVGGASVAVASLTFSGTGVTGSGAVVIDGPSTVSLGTSTATGITIGNGSSTIYFPSHVEIGTTTPIASLGVASEMKTGIGTVDSDGDGNVTGTGTHFITELAVGELFYRGGDPYGSITSISDDTHLTVSSDDGNGPGSFTYQSPVFRAFGMDESGDVLPTFSVVGGSVGIETTTPAYPLDVNGAINTNVGYYLNGSPVGGSVGDNGQIQYNNSGQLGGSVMTYDPTTNSISTPGEFHVLVTDSDNVHSDSAYDGTIIYAPPSDFTIGTLFGATIDAAVSGTYAWGTVYGGRFGANNLGSGAVNSLISLYADQISDSSGGTAQQAIGLDVADQSAASNVATYGIKVESQNNGGDNHWAIQTGVGKVDFGDVVQIATSTFSHLPTCDSGEEGTQHPVTDSLTSTWGATVTGSGSDHILAYCDGTNWTVMAK